jgi:hypothetical protein
MNVDDPRAMAILVQALKRTDTAVRTGYLDGACGDDNGLRGRVEALLAAQGGAGWSREPADTAASEPASLPEGKATSSSVEPTQPPTGRTPGEHPPGGTATTVEDIRPGGPHDGSLMGQVIAGRYRLIGVRGEGGMGTVYRAEQTQPVRRPVALKLIRVGLDSRAVLARFDAERQALALMDHPNIARVYDGGTTAAGQPFFAMELVNGVPITDYCDLNPLSHRPKRSKCLESRSKPRAPQRLLFRAGSRAMSLLRVVVTASAQIS